MTRPNIPPVRDGRSSRCPTCRGARLCLSCQQRIRYGEPSTVETWAARLRLSEDQLNLLLIGAQEFVDLHRRYVKRAQKFGMEIPPMPTPVEFMDWLRPSISRPVYVTTDGAPARNTEGSLAQNRGQANLHRHPDPIPYYKRPKPRSAA